MKILKQIFKKSWISNKKSFSKEKLRVEEIKTDSNYFEYIVINDALKDVKKPDKDFSLGIKLFLKKEPTADDDLLFQKMFYKIKKTFNNKKDILYFAYRIERHDHREIMFYANLDNLSSIKIEKMIDCFYFNESLKITIELNKILD